jgi:hypothetical protein
LRGSGLIADSGDGRRKGNVVCFASPIEAMHAPKPVLGTQMRSFWRIRVIFAVGAIVLCQSVLCADENAGTQFDSAVALVKTMHYHEFMLLAVETGARVGVNGQPPAKHLLECLSAQDPTIFILPLASTVSANLTQEEIYTATAFFASSAGQRRLEETEVSVYTTNGLVPRADRPKMSNSETLQVMEFERSSLSAKLFGSQVLRSSETRENIRRIGRTLLSKCGWLRVP